ncbi:MAG TPA: aldehyde dehydrogenase family protein [Terriglobales bacterium]|nr:aldehyde dehydrogenase family protein [Terriglobales bacterium]
MITATKSKIEPGKLLIGGEWVDSGSGRTFKTVNPATGEVITEVASAQPQDVDRAVQAARRAFDDLSGPWRKMTASERGKTLWRVADLIEKNIDEISEIETLDNGKPIFESRYVDVPTVIEVFRYYAGWATKVHGETINSRPDAFTYTLREPLGVVAAIVPWNFPLLLAAWKIAPALAMGNTVIWKPATQTSLSALRVGQLMLEAGVPAGVVNILPGAGAVVGMGLVKHPGVDKVAFTGSTVVGKEVMRNAADTVKRITLELGGKSPNIVFADSDLDAAVKGASTGIFYGKGEVCAAGSRLFVERKIHDEFMSRLIDRTKKLKPGDPLDPKTRLGAIVSEQQMNTVLGYIDAGKNEGAKLVTGGNRASVDGGKGYFIEPTIFDNVDNQMKIAQEEIFGPVLATIPFDDVDHVAELANQNIYGLAAAVWTNDVKKAHRVARELKAGTVWINAYNLYDVALPFGGFKQSGFGRELGMHAIEHYTELKSVWLNLA